VVGGGGGGPPDCVAGLQVAIVLQHCSFPFPILF